MSFLKSLFKSKPSGAAEVLPHPRGSAAFNAHDASSYPRLFCTDINHLDSQGLHVSDTGSCAFVHASTSPPNYYVYKYGDEYKAGINMDRGGFGLSSDGSNFGCVCDGVTAGGKVNAYAAQVVTEYMLHWLSQYHGLLSEDTATLQMQLEHLFQQAADFKNNRPGEHNAEGGAATLAFATFKRLPTDSSQCILVGGSIGDAACIVLHPQHGGRMVTRLHRGSRDKLDTGGQITMCMGVHGDPFPHVHKIPVDCHVILSTDGLTDNISKHEIQQIVPLIASSPFFQKPVDEEHSTLFAELPSYDHLLRLVKDQGRDRLTAVSCADVAIRLTNYLNWVTRKLHDREQEFYLWSHQLRLEHSKPVPDASVVAKCEKQLERFRKAKATIEIAGKTDDAIILVLRPFHQNHKP